uniref:Coiled-coil domain-containing protein n=1 Tax=Caenorhabditis tropicalis TaxID=1561998 RepID=A0A1I7UGF4_9PELO
MELSELESSLKAVKDIAKAAKQERSDYKDPLPPISLEYTAVEVPLYSSDNGNGKPNPKVCDEPKLAEDAEKIVHKAVPASDQTSLHDKSCKQKLKVDVEFMQRFHNGMKERNGVDKFLEVWEAHMEQREKRKELWKPYENETQRLIEQSLAKINEINQENFQWLSFYNTSLGEKLCSDWLEAVRAPIARAKQHYSSLPKHSDQNYLKFEYPCWVVFLESSVVNPAKILTPSELREIKKSSNEDEEIKDPIVYQNRHINIKDFI